MTEKMPTPAEVINAYAKAMADIDRERLDRGESMIPMVQIENRAIAILYGEKTDEAA
jgi:limonene-1,2-epoxide hydrolase